MKNKTILIIKLLEIVLIVLEMFHEILEILEHFNTL